MKDLVMTHMNTPLQNVLDKIQADSQLIEENAVINHYMKQLDCKDLNELKSIVDNLHSLLSTLE